MIGRLTRRTVMLGLAGGLALPAFAEAPAGSSRVVLEMLAFRQAGAPPRPMPLAPLSGVSTIAGRVEMLGADSWQLGGAKGALVGRGGLQVLAHTAWAAIVPPNGRTTARLEDVLSEDTGLAGAVALQRSQYLFLGVDVDYVSGANRYGIREKRRVKFGERHYFDHPAFGLIVQIRPGRGGALSD